MHLSPQAWLAVWASVAFVAALAACCFLPPAWEAIRAGQHRRETARIAGDKTSSVVAELIADAKVPAAHQAHGRWGVGELFERLRARNARILDEREARRG